MRPSYIGLAAVLAALFLASVAGQSAAQNAAEPTHDAAPAPAPAAPARPPAGAGPPRAPAYPAVRSTDPAAVQRGRTLFVETFGCASCHAADIRGGANGNSLLRSGAMMQDANGELIATATRASRAHAGRFNAISEAQYSDLAQYMKSFTNIGTGPSVAIIKPVVFQSGDAASGKRFFASNCARCHAVTRGESSSGANLAGIGAGVEAAGAPARDLQQRWLSPMTEKPVKVVVTMPDGQKLEGDATKLNEFVLEMTLADGAKRTIERDGDTPKIVLTYPLAAHAALLRKITDKQINDVTGYLVTLK